MANFFFVFQLPQKRSIFTTLARTALRKQKIYHKLPVGVIYLRRVLPIVHIICVELLCIKMPVLKLLRILLYLSIVGILSAQAQPVSQPNVLLIMLDDFRPAIKAFGDVNAITPNIDRLAKKGYFFTNVFAQVRVFL